LSVYDKCHRRPPEEKGVARFDESHWPPLSQRDLSPVIDVEDHSMMLMQLDNGVLASYQQCHFTPDGWRNYTIIGTEGRLENFGDDPGNCVVRLWNRRCSYNPYGYEQFFIAPTSGGHGGADPSIVQEFIEHVRFGRKVTTSPVAARQSVAAGFLATHSLRHGGIPMNVPKLPTKIAAYFNAQLARGL